MKKLFLTMLVALFATAVLGQAGLVITPMDCSNLPQCVKDYVSTNNPKYMLDAAQSLQTPGNIVSNLPNGKKSIIRGMIWTYEVRLKLNSKFMISPVYPAYLFYQFSSDCKTVTKIANFTQIPH